MMSLSFLHPLFLLGLAAGILPILIHRLTKRKATQRKFSAVRLLLKSQQVVTRPQRLKHLLLLALRILAVLSLAFMMAQPVLSRQGLLAMKNEGAKVVILDNSLSMGYREDRGERYTLAKKAVKEVMEGGKAQVIIIPTSDIQAGETRWMGSEEALRKLEEIPLSFGRGDITSALIRAYRKLKDLKMDKEILILSDMTREDWEGFNVSKLGIIPADVGLTLLRIGGPKRDSNFAIKAVKLVEGEAVAGVPCRVEVTVCNLSDHSGSTLIHLYLSGIKVDQKSIDLKAGEEGKALFDLFLGRAGWVNGEVRCSEDRLASDDIFYFPLKVREKIRVLIVDGDPRTSLKASESYYLVNALNPAGQGGSPFLARVITEEELMSLDLRPYDAVFLLNTARPHASRLSPILDSGKPLFIFLGDRILPDEYNSEWNNLSILPWRISGLKGEEDSKPEKVTQIDDRYHALASFSGVGGESLKSASFRRYYNIEGGTKNLLTLGNKDPLLVEANFGKGRVFLFVSSADLDWNDLPLKAAYLPFIQELLKEAVGLSPKDSLPAPIRWGEPFEEKARPTQIAGPRGGPGIYQFFIRTDEFRRGVNPPFEESDLSKLTDQEMNKKFGRIDMKVVEVKEGALKGGLAARVELWPYLLAFIMAVLGIEMAVANGVPRANSSKPLRGKSKPVGWTRA